VTVEWTKQMMIDILDKLMADVGKEEPKPSIFGRIGPRVRDIFGKGNNGPATRS